MGVIYKTANKFFKILKEFSIQTIFQAFFLQKEKLVNFSKSATKEEKRINKNLFKTKVSHLLLLSNILDTNKTSARNLTTDVQFNHQI